MRKVKVFNYHSKTERGIATFHQFGLDCNERVSWTTAVIEYDNGQIENIPVEQIQFIIEEDK